MLRAALERAWWRPRPGGLAILLGPLARVYAALWALRRLGYQRGWLKRRRAPVPVVVVGNLIVGGAGKTPTVIALVRALRERGWTPGVISRGYGGGAAAPIAVTPATDAREVGDEPTLILRRTDAPVWVGRRRAAVARALCAAHPEVDLIVADDGLQHLALERDAQLVVFDERGLGNGRLLPAGPLREPFATVPAPRTAVLYNAATPTTPWPGALVERRLAGALPLRDWWAGQAANPAGLADLRGRTVLAAAGIASPERFFAMLEAEGLTIERRPLADHAPLDPRPWPADAPIVVVTEKDAVKLPPTAPDAAAIHVATLDFEIPAETVATLHGWLEPLRRR